MGGPIPGGAPFSLVLVGAAGAVLGGYLLFYLLGRLYGRLVDRPRVPLSGVSYFVILSLCLGALAVGFAGLGTVAIARDLFGVTGRAALGKFRCEPQQKAGGGCPVVVEIYRLRGLHARLGLEALVRVERGGTGAPAPGGARWLTPAGPGTASPLRLIVRESQVVTLATPPDGAAYDLVVTASGAELVKAPG